METSINKIVQKYCIGKSQPTRLYIYKCANTIEKVETGNLFRGWASVRVTRYFERGSVTNNIKFESIKQR